MQVETSNKIKNMGFLCALLVVMQHIPQSGWIGRMESLTQIAVPFFFVVSGYFFVKDADSKDWWAKAMAKRLRTLLIPYLVICLSWFGMHDLIRGMTSGLILIAALGLNLCAWPAVAPLWYVRALLLYMVIAPVVYWFVAKSKLWAGLLTMPIVMAGIWFLVPSGGFPTVLCRNTFAIYVIHWQLSHLTHAMTKSEIATVYFVVCVLGSILIAELLRKLSPRFANIVLGGR